MTYLGDFAADQAINFLWSTNDGDGASITRSTDGTISVYKDNSDGSSYDETQSTEGVTNDEDFDSLTGIHECCITTTNAWYEVGHDYTVVLSAAVIDTQDPVNAVLAHFSIENRFNQTVVPDAAGTAATQAEVATECADALSDIKLDHLVNSAAAEDEVADNSIIARLAATEGDWSEYNDETDSLEAIKVHNDTIKAETALIVEDTNELQTDDIPALIGTAQADLDTLTGADGVTLATAQGNYAPNTVVPDAAGVAPTAQEIWDLASARTDDFGTLLEQLADFHFNELRYVNATGVGTLRNKADSGDLASWKIEDDDTNTDRDKVVWS